MLFRSRLGRVGDRAETLFTVSSSLFEPWCSSDVSTRLRPVRREADSSQIQPGAAWGRAAESPAPSLLPSRGSSLPKDYWDRLGTQSDSQTLRQRRPGLDVRPLQNNIAFYLPSPTTAPPNQTTTTSPHRPSPANHRYKHHATPSDTPSLRPHSITPRHPSTAIPSAPPRLPSPSPRRSSRRYRSTGFYERCADLGWTGKGGRG